jgi:hypothetical protein
MSCEDLYEINLTFQTHMFLERINL